MNIYFQLKTPKGESSPIRLVITHKGKLYRYSTGITIPTCQWKTYKNKDSACTDSKVNDRLKSIKIELEYRLNQFSKSFEIEDAVAEVLRKKNVHSNSNDDFMAEYYAWATEKKSKGLSSRVSCGKTLQRIMGQTILWSDIDEEWYHVLVDRMTDAGYMRNTIFSTMSVCIKAVLNIGKRKGLWKGSTTFIKTHRFDSFSIYLTQEEVDRLWAAKLEGIEQKVRDLFLLGVFTASRYSDYSRLSSENIIGNKIEFMQAKTLTRVTLPLSPKVKEILERNGGAAPKMNYKTLNKYVKLICKECGIDSTYEYSEQKGSRAVKVTKQKWELVSTHTARRTGATLLYLSGVPVAQCRMITGHTTDEMFLRYVKVTKEENADLLASNPFFK